jgi:hypothetical protein
MRYATTLVSATAFLLGLGFTALAATSSNEVLSQQGREFACTGVGDDAQNNPRWNKFPLKMVFTNRAGDYLGDVQVQVMNSNGDTLVEAHCMAPWLLADLDAGSYKAKVMAPGADQKTVDFRVQGAGQTQVVVTFTDLTGT